jgi:hypothetical protein
MSTLSVATAIGAIAPADFVEVKLGREAVRLARA